MYQWTGNDVAMAGLACTRTLSQYEVIDKYDVISGNSGVPTGRQWPMTSQWLVWRAAGPECTLSQYDVIDKYDVISGNSGVPAGGQ